MKAFEVFLDLEGVIRIELDESDYPGEDLSQVAEDKVTLAMEELEINGMEAVDMNVKVANVAEV